MADGPITQSLRDAFDAVAAAVAPDVVPIWREDAFLGESQSLPLVIVSPTTASPLVANRSRVAWSLAIQVTVVGSTPDVTALADTLAANLALDIIQISFRYDVDVGAFAAILDVAMPQGGQL